LEWSVVHPNRSAVSPNGGTTIRIPWPLTPAVRPFSSACMCDRRLFLRARRIARYGCVTGDVEAAQNNCIAPDVDPAQSWRARAHLTSPEHAITGCSSPVPEVPLHGAGGRRDFGEDWPGVKP